MRVSEYDEDFTVYYFQDYLPDWDYVPILLKDPNPVSPETHEELSLTVSPTVPMI